MICVCVCVLWWKNRAVGSDTVKMTGQSDVSDSHGTAGRAELRLRWETAEVSLTECYVGVARIVQFLFFFFFVLKEI